jgi:hypothetical protein
MILSLIFTDGDSQRNQMAEYAPEHTERSVHELQGDASQHVSSDLCGAVLI